MGFRRCPGSVAFSQPTIELVRCPHCGGDAELWTDEAEAPCTKCGKPVVRTTRQSCVDWCKYAEECLGEEKYKKYLDTKSAMRKEALVHATADCFGWDETLKDRARALVSEAESVLSGHPDADPNVVLATVVLRLAVQPPATETTTTAGPEVDEQVRSVLERLNYPRGFVNQVCGLVAVPPVSQQDPNAPVVRAIWARAGM